MRILLAQNSQFFPAHGGGEKSNRLLIEALAARGHACRVVGRLGALGEASEREYLAELKRRGVTASSRAGVVEYSRADVDVRIVSNTLLRAEFLRQVAEFRPDVIVASTDDPAQIMLQAALEVQDARVVYLMRATIAAPFGPDCAFPSERMTERLRAVDQVVGVSNYVADYCRQYAGIPAVHVPISLLDHTTDWPYVGAFENRFVTMVNPCAVKGLSIFLELADAFPKAEFAAVPTWGANDQDMAAMRARANVSLLDPVDDIIFLMRETRVLLVPSLWAEARSRVVLEAMACGVPVIAANVGGMPEAKLGVPYLLPVNPIQRYNARVDERMVPVAETPQQEIGPWREALGRLLTDRQHYAELSRESRAAAMGYVGNLSAEPFEDLLEEVLKRPTWRPAAGLCPEGPHCPTKTNTQTLSPEKRRLIGIRLRKRAPASAWFPGAEEQREFRLFWFPHAGGGTAQADTEAPFVCPVLLPGRGARLVEAPFEKMSSLVAALADAFEHYLNVPFAFFGHSMGAGVAFELTRELRRRGRPLPQVLIASAARAPSLRRTPAPEITPEQFREELRRLSGAPPDLWDEPGLFGPLEADAKLYRGYVYTEDAPLPCPIRVYSGADDPSLGREHLEPWARETTASFGLHLFPGGHFYFQSTQAEFRDSLNQDLKDTQKR